MQGRINIAKTYMYSQISYTSCIITPTMDQIREMERVIGGYVKNRLNISTDRVFKEADIGGLGLPKITEFITAIQCSWIKKIYQSSNDLWRHNAWELTNGNCLTACQNVVRKNENPIIWNIFESWSKFTHVYYAQNNNFKRMYIMNNTFFTRSEGNNDLLDHAFFAQNPELDKTKLVKIRYDDISINGRMKEYNQLCADLAMPITVATYFRMATAFRAFSQTLRGIEVQNNNTGLWLNTFLGTFKKGSKKVRNYFIKARVSAVDMTRNASVATFHINCDVEIPPDNLVKKFYGEWCNTYYSNPLKEVMFKMVNNLLPLNTRVHHYVQGTTRGCTFCELKTYRPAPDETTLHLFFECPITTGWREKFCSDFFGIASATVSASKEQWFSRTTDNLGKNDYSNYLKWCFMFTVWEHKLRHKAPGWFPFKEELNININRGVATSSWLQIKYLIFRNQLLQVPAPE